MFFPPIQRSNDKTSAELEQDYSQLLTNARSAKSYDETTYEIDMFFIEINIKRLIPKSEHSYRFGQVFIRNEAGSKIFYNQPVDHYYADKIGLIDLFEAYDITTLVLILIHPSMTSLKHSST